MGVLGIIGLGFVGQAVKEGMSSHYSIETYDKFKTSSCNSIQELCNKTQTIFISVPTPMDPSGVCNTNIVQEVIKEVDNYSNGHLCIIKSTVPPGTTNNINSLCKNTKVVFNPEFLTEANFIQDFKNQNRIIVGGDNTSATKVCDIYKNVFPSIPILKTDSAAAEMVKYFTNCFLATKVSFSNEIRQICEKLNIEYKSVVQLALKDERIGKTHFASPGPDSKYGFGGSCFPKDINALIAVAESLGLEPHVLRAAWQKNLEVRPGKDWEKLKGRAVSE